MAQIPKVYSLKKEIARGWRNVRNGDMIKGLVTAPVFMFDMDELIGIEAGFAMDKLLENDNPMNGPYESYLFEAHWDRDGERTVYVVYAADAGHTKVFYFFPFNERGWLNVVCRLVATYAPLERFKHTLEYDYPDGIDDELRDSLKSIFLTTLIRGLSVLSVKHTREACTVSRIRRQMLNAPGVSGWDYYVLKVDPFQPEATAPAGASESLGGTHASPRWHMRRGHWRTLRNGRRVFVRATEVGDKERGGVVKDYEVKIDDRAMDGR